MALEDTTGLLVPKEAFFRLLEAHPTLMRGLLHALTRRLVDRTSPTGSPS